MANSPNEDQKIDSIKLRVEKQNAEREAAGLPSLPSSSSSPVERDPSETLGDPNAPEHEWVAAAEELNKKEERQKNTTDKELKKHDAFTDKFLLVFFAIIIVLAGFALFIPTLHPTQTPPIQQYVAPPPQQVTQDIDFKPYMDALQTSIKKNWHPSGAGDHVVRVKFKVHKNGEISDLAFDRMSRSPENDAAVMKAIIASMPSLPPLPEGSPENVDIQFTFEYKVHDAPAGNAPAQN
ncbi:MAG: TonB C-terminal domain-containing protein [Candidatus Obscuribacterales bacterium]|nr:TonB C-terminal domain-containing protein [Candidatus Obscuribacterales bacterium]